MSTGTSRLTRCRLWGGSIVERRNGLVFKKENITGKGIIMG